MVLLRTFGPRILSILVLTSFMGNTQAIGQKPTIRLFQVDYQQELQWKALRSNRNVRILNYDPIQYQFLKQQKLTSFNLLLPGLEGDDIEVELVENKVLSEDFVLSTDKSRNLSYTPGLYYSGKIKGQDHSLVVISLFENEVMGMITPPGRSNLVIGNSPVLRRNSFILFDDGQVDAPAFACYSSELPNWTKDLNTVQGGFRQQQSAAGCIKVYLECGLSVNEGKGGVSGASNFVTSLFNAVSTLYSREGLNTNISEIKIWTTQEPYGGSADRALEDFGAALAGNFNGNLAHFLRLKTGTFSGLAWLDVLCRTNRYAYSEISSSFSAFPTYSWTVDVITHEMGHNLGSPHTQSCTWPGGPIDNCASPEGTCAPGPVPTEGGTIMSYCHQITNIGINFNNGFGPLPGNRIRDRYNNATCLTDCNSSGEVVASPDLVISSVSANPAELSAKAPSSTVTFNTSNIGNSAAVASSSTAYFSIDNSLSSNDQTITNVNIAALNAGTATANNISFSLPSGTSPGNYYIIVCADHSNTVQESSEANNCRSVLLTVIQALAGPPIPDPPNPVFLPDLILSVTSTVPQLMPPGFALNIQGQVTNQGPGKAEASKVGIVLSTDGIYSDNDILLSTTNIPSLDLQVINNFNSPVTMPLGLPSENYQLIVCADMGNVITETDDGNNCKNFAINIHSDKPDLIPKDLQINPVPAPSGSPFNVVFTNLNQGAINSNPFWTGIYLSKNNKTRDADDLLLGQLITDRGLSAFQSRVDQFSISTLISPGNFTILVCSDDRNEVAESDETNNCSPATITISAPLPDLIIQKFLTPSEFYLGDTQTLRLIIRNEGYLKSGICKAKLSISTTPSASNNSAVIAGINLPSIGVNESFETTVKVLINETKWLGRPYFILCADSEYGVKESNESNNCRENQTFIREPLPDLKLITKSVLTEPIASGSSFQFPFILVNSGRKLAQGIESEIYISEKSLIKTSIAVSLYLDTLPLINPGDTINKALSLELPPQLTAGTYYLNICTDYKLKIKEESETNNCLSYKLQIRNLYADIVLDEFELMQETLYSSLPTTIQIGLFNPGEIAFQDIDVVLFAAANKDTSVMGTLEVSSLDPGQHWDTSFIVNLPSTIENQQVHFWVYGDPGNKIPEVNEENNFAELTKMVFEPLVDLDLLNLSIIDSSFYSGGPLPVNLTILNKGLVQSPEFTVSVWLIESVENKIHPDTVLTLSFDHLSMPPGKVDSIQSMLNLPQAIRSGPYQIFGMVDPLKNIKESDESNNDISAPVAIIQRLPDIQALDFQVPESLDRYQDLTGSLQVFNSGDWDMPALLDTVYLSVDSVRSTDDAIAGIINLSSLSPGQTTTVNLNWRIPDLASTGTQYLLLTLDAQDQFSEQLKSNNSIIKQVSIPFKKADLQLTGLQLAKSIIFPGDTLLITNFIENIGESNTNSFEVVQFIKKHPLDSSVIYRFPSTRIADGIKPGQDKELTSQVWLPDSLSATTYYLISCLDLAGEIDELRKDNNCAQLIVTVHSKQGISTGLKQDLLFAHLKAFPNPVAQILHLSGTLNQSQNQMGFTVRDYTGRILLHQRLQSGIHFNFQVDLSNLPSGLYCFDLRAPGGIWKQTFIKL